MLQTIKLKIDYGDNSIILELPIDNEVFCQSIALRQIEWCNHNLKGLSEPSQSNSPEFIDLNDEKRISKNWMICSNMDFCNSKEWQLLFSLLGNFNLELHFYRLAEMLQHSNESKEKAAAALKQQSS